MAADIRRRPVATCGGYCYAMPPHSGALVSSAGRKRPATLLMLPPLEIGRIAAVFPAVRFRHIGRRQGQPANIAGRDRRVTPRRHTPRCDSIAAKNIGGPQGGLANMLAAMRPRRIAAVPPLVAQTPKAACATNRRHTPGRKFLPPILADFGRQYQAAILSAEVLIPIVLTHGVNTIVIRTCEFYCGGS